MIFWYIPTVSILQAKEGITNEGKQTKTVIGLYGETKTLSEDWLKRQSDFISLEYISNGKDRFFTKGTLSGILINGKIVSIDIQEDFFDKDPGMILDHLNALRHRSRIESFVKKDLKRQFIVSEELRKWMETSESAWEEKRKQKINSQLTELLQKDLSTAEKEVISRLEKELEPKIQKMVSAKIEIEVRKEFPGLTQNRINRLITQKKDRELINRVEREMENTILNEIKDDSSEWKEASPLIHRVISQNRLKITSQVNAEHAALKNKRLKAMRKRFNEEGRVWSKKKPVSLFKKILLRIEKWWNDEEQ